MRWLVVAIVLRAAVAHACENEEECGPYERWSWTPLIGIQGAYSANDHGQAVVDAELRLRLGSHRHPDVFTYSLAVESANLATIDPQVLFGYDFIDDDIGSRDQLELSLDAHVALGGGRSFGPTDHTFVVAQLGLGTIFQRASGHRYEVGCIERQHEPCEEPMYRHTTQADFVFELRVTAQGDVRLSAGLELDPVRIWSAIAAFNR